MTDMSPPNQPIVFDDGAAYETMMGRWSRLAGEVFLDWLAPSAGLRWLDVGCGTGAFAQLMIERCAPKSVDGLDPSPAQLAFARKRAPAVIARFHHGDATELPFPDDSFDVAVMALVIFFLETPALGVAEMARVVRPGGTVATYAWDMEGGGFPLAVLLEELNALGRTVAQPPSPAAAGIEALRALWLGASLLDIETREIEVRRTFLHFEDLWETSRLGSSVKPVLAEMPPDEIATLRTRLRDRFPAGDDGRITCGARANAVWGRVAPRR